MASSIICPFCGRENDSHAPTGNDYQIPEEGDVSICWKCHGVGIFQGDGTVRKPSPEEDANLRAAPEIADALMVISKAQGPTKAADILRTAERWEGGTLQ